MSVPEYVFFPQTVDPLNTACLLWYKESTVSVEVEVEVAASNQIAFLDSIAVAR